MPSSKVRSDLNPGVVALPDQIASLSVAFSDFFGRCSIRCLDRPTCRDLVIVKVASESFATVVVIYTTLASTPSAWGSRALNGLALDRLALERLLLVWSFCAWT